MASYVSNQTTLTQRLELPRSVGRTRFYVAFSCLALLVSVPFLVTQTPPLLDYPNHLARVFVLRSWGSDEFLRQYYQPNWNVLPNLAFDGLGLTLHTILPIYIAGQVALLVTVLLLSSGLVVLSATLHGEPKWFSLFGFLFVFSHPFTYGFINLMLGFGLVLWGVAIWIRVRDRSLMAVLLWSVPFALLLFFSHLFAFAVFGVTLTCIELTRLRTATRPFAALRRLAFLGTAQAVIPFSLFLFASPTPLSSSTTSYVSGIPRRLLSMALSPIRNYDDTLDVLTVVVVVLFLASGLWTRRLHVAKDMQAALVALGVLCLLMPDTVSTSGNAEIRLPVIVALLFTASASWTAAVKWTVPASAMLFTLLLTARTWVTVDEFTRGSQFVSEVQRALAMAPRGYRIASITVTTLNQHRMRPEWLHSICYEVIEKSAMVPSLFTYPEQQPLLLRSRSQGRVFPSEHYRSQPERPLHAALFEHLDYVLLVNPGALQTHLPENLEFVSAGNEFQLYRVLRQ